MSEEPCEDLKAKTQAIEKKMLEAKKKERNNALLELKRFCIEFGFTARMLKGSLAKGHG